MLNSNSSRKEILQRIAAAQIGRLAYVNDAPIKTDNIYKPILPDPVTCFQRELESISGHCILCENDEDRSAKIKKFISEQNLTYLYCRDVVISKYLENFDIAFSNKDKDFINMKAGITSCEYLVARTGSIIITSASQSGRQMNVFPPIHIVLAHVSQIVNYPEDALVAIQKKYGDNFPSVISTITGPSRTADIEKTLVLGAHGPKEIIVFLSKV